MAALSESTTDERFDSSKQDVTIQHMQHQEIGIVPESHSSHIKPDSPPNDSPIEQGSDVSKRTTSSGDQYSEWKSDAFPKILVFITAILPVIIIIAILVLTIRDIRSTGPLLSFASNDRATTQIVVSFASFAISSLNIYTITQLLNLATRIHLLQQSLSLNMINLIGAISTGRATTALPVLMSSTTIITFLIFTVPNVLWTGVLTPVLTNATIAETNILKVPRYSTSSNDTWSNGKFWHSNCTTLTNKVGIFSDCPVNTIQSSMLKRSAQATSNLTYSKNDNSLYSYVGRSYGVGSPAGLVDENLFSGHSTTKLLSYKYEEPGYLTRVKCFHNASSDWHLELIQEGQRQYGIPYIYYAIGMFPNAPPGHGVDFLAFVGLLGDYSIVALGATPYQKRNIILLTSGQDYQALNGTQCEVFFTPTKFTVNVDVANKLISVNPTNITETSSGVSLFDPTNGLVVNVIRQINGLGGESTTLYTSTIGDALMFNIAAITSDSASDAAFAAIADSFSAMVDDLLVFIGSSQFFIPDAGAGDYSTVDAEITVQAVRIGDPKYVYETFAICIVLLLAVVIETFRTKAWKLLPKWDFTDTNCLVIASAVAGNDLIYDVCEKQNIERLDWSGGGSDHWRVHPKEQGTEQKESLGKMRLRLGRKVTKVAVNQLLQDGKEMDEQHIQLSAVSMWTDSADNVTFLCRHADIGEADSTHSDIKVV
jgi:hypothetical protein